MPSRSVGSVFIEISIIVLMMSVVGHLTVNFWERYFVKTELAQMKESLHALKKTLLNIGNAYDTLHGDITELTTKNTLQKTAFDKMRFINSLDRRRLHDIEVIAIVDAKDAYPNPTNEKKEVFNLFSKSNAKEAPNISAPNTAVLNDPIEFYQHKKNKGHEVMSNVALQTMTKYPSKDRNMLKNMTTMTRNPPKSAGVGSFAAM